MKKILWLCAMLSGALAQAQPPPAAEPANEADNPGFEDRLTGAIHLPSRWDPFASGGKLLASLTDTIKRSGERSVRLGAVGVKGAFVGLVQQKPVKPKMRYTFSAHLLSDPEAPMSGGCEALISLEWYDEAGQEVGRDESPVASSLSRTQWREMSVTGKPPARAARVKFTVLLREERPACSGWICIDDAVVVAR